MNLLKNWQTTSVGLTMIIGSVVHLVFASKAGTATEGVWTASFTAIVGGAGLILAGDAKASAQAHEETKQIIKEVADKAGVDSAPIVEKVETAFIKKP